MVCHLCGADEKVTYIKLPEGEVRACKDCRESYERYKDARTKTEV